MGNDRTVEYPVIWIQCATCTGCSVSVLNSVSPTIKNVLVDEVIPGKHVNLRFQATVMAGAGDIIIEEMEATAQQKKGSYILVVEGAVPTAGNAADYGSIGEKNGRLVPMVERVESLGRDAAAVIALGTCATFGGIAAGAPNPSKSIGVGKLFEQHSVTTPLINIPGSKIAVGFLAPISLSTARRRRCAYGVMRSLIIIKQSEKSMPRTRKGAIILIVLMPPDIPPAIGLASGGGRVSSELLCEQSIRIGAPVFGIVKTEQGGAGGVLYRHGFAAFV